MTLLLITTVLVSGLGSLSSSVPHQFHVVKEQKTWTEAQQYCREKFTDLATIDDMTENGKVKSKTREAGVKKAWIGLKKGSSSKWQWSLADRDFYKENETEFRDWGPGYPTAQKCVYMWSDGHWYDNVCSYSGFPFICYDGGDSTHPYVLVTELKTWTAAQRYCREKHTDLASVRNQAENDQIEKVSGSSSVWIGLFRDEWEWSDGSESSFRHWSTGKPGSPGVVCTEITASGQWVDSSCHQPNPFICYGEPEVKRQIVRVSFPVASEVDMNDPAVLKAVLQQIQERLKKSGMPADAKLSWKKQPDGKIFKKEEKKKKEEGKKRRKRTEL